MTEIILTIAFAYIASGLLVALVWHQHKERQNLNDAFDKYLKHIEKLERMTLPKPVTEKDVKSVLERVGEITDQGKFDNDIEQEKDKGVELPDDDWTGFINADTKVAFDGEPEPTVVE